jgi:hypothetical protein
MGTCPEHSISDYEEDEDEHKPPPVTGVSFAWDILALETVAGATQLRLYFLQRL